MLNLNLNLNFALDGEIQKLASRQSQEDNAPYKFLLYARITQYHIVYLSYLLNSDIFPIQKSIAIVLCHYLLKMFLDIKNLIR